jgi:hypothetical protein
MAYADGRLTVAGTSMTLLFIYDLDGSDPIPVDVLRLNAPFLEMVGKPMESDAGFGSSLIANPPPVEMAANENQIVGMSPVFQRIRMWNDHIFLQEPQEHSLIVLKRERNTYTYHLRVRLVDEAGQIIRGLEFQIRPPYLYLASYAQNRIYRFELNRLDK